VAKELRRGQNFFPVPKALGPEGAAGCSHGWSGGAAEPADAEPVEAGLSFSLFAPEGRRLFD